MAFTWFTWNGAESFVFAPQLPWSFPTGFSKNIPRWQKMPSCKPGWSDLQPPQKLQATQLGKHRKKQHSCPCSAGLVCGKLHHKEKRLKLNDSIDFLHMLDGCWFPQKCVWCWLISFLWHCQLYFWMGWEQQKVLMVAELMTKPLCPPMPIQWGCGEEKTKKRMWSNLARSLCRDWKCQEVLCPLSGPHKLHWAWRIWAAISPHLKRPTRGPDVYSSLLHQKQKRRR